MKTLILAAIRCSLIFTAVTGSLFSVQPAQAYTVTLMQVGSTVVATGSGPIDLTGLTLLETGSSTSSPLEAHLPRTRAGVMPLFAQINTGPTHSSADMYGGNTRGPTSFGLGVLQLADTGSGDFVGIDGVGGPPFQTLLVPLGYMSGAALSNSMTFDDATFLLLTPGTYVWRWGDGVNQRFTLQIGAVPDGGSTVSLLGCALLGLAALRRKLGC